MSIETPALNRAHRARRAALDALSMAIQDLEAFRESRAVMRLHEAEIAIRDARTWIETSTHAMEFSEGGE